MLTQHETFLRQTFELARQAAQSGNDPFGSLLVLNDQVVATSADQCIQDSDPTAHAELQLIRTYCRTHKRIHLKNFTLYTNVEPCIMCSGAIHWAKLTTVVFGMSQQSLQSFSGGQPKPSCHDLINAGGKTITIIGPLLETEARQVFEAFPFQSKIERHQKMHGPF